MLSSSVEPPDDGDVVSGFDSVVVSGFGVVSGSVTLIVTEPETFFALSSEKSVISPLKSKVYSPADCGVNVAVVVTVLFPTVSV